MSQTPARPRLLDDLPMAEEAHLWPGLRALGDQVAELLPSLPVTSPVLISGDWGSGKTTLLLAVQRRLAAQDPPLPAIWFDAWRHEGSGPLLPALMRRVWEEAPPEVRGDEKAKGVFRKLFAAAVAVGVRAAPALLGLGGLTLGADILKGITATALRADVAAVEGPDARPLEPPPDPTVELWRSYKALVDAAWPGRSPVIIVDDLDRCSPAGAVDLLDHLRVLVAGATELNSRFVVAMDRGVLVQAIATKFTGITGYDGNRYLEKVFPITFTLPSPQGRDVARLVSSFLAPHEAVGLSTEHQDALSLALNDPLFANPRLMKRCINRFRMVVAFEARSGPAPTRTAAEGAAADRALAKWIAASERFPLLRRLVVQQGDEFWRELEEALGRSPPGALGQDGDRLVKEEAIPWVRREIFGGGAGRLSQLREAEARLRRWGL